MHGSKTRLDYRSAYHPGLRGPQKDLPACHHHPKEHEPRNGIRRKTSDFFNTGFNVDPHIHMGNSALTSNADW
ncbi:hypothetical protein G5I_04397 [Acromyrmex echinatior]|uniref:Uncharacterized protein n=1 Tax=Acromyrmex echinatior TaxID=103372 RepID=F4WFI8_ACREC|nr:hypothetical protein G5I_04397 [Acromyrmex echinatior]